MKAHLKYRDKGVVFLGMATANRSSLDESQAFLDEHQITWPNAFGADQSIDAFEVKVYPTKFVVGRDGTIRWNSVADRQISLEEAIDSALADET